LLDKLDANQSQRDDCLIDKIALRELISQLNTRERQIIMMRYFKDMTQSQIAREIGVSQVQVSRIEKRVLASMRAKLLEA